MKECPVCKSCFPDDVNNCPNDGEPTSQTIVGEPVLDGRYLLERRLGQGGMGVVFKARHVFLKTQHAIKVILPDLVGNDPMLVTRFRQEALAAAAIRHQNIIAVTDFGVARGTMPFLVMEFVNGESLHDVLAREGALPAAKALEMMYAIGSGVAAAHRQGIVHRDLKPLNVMLQEGLPVNEAIKILDFGLAKIKSGELLGSFVQAQTTGLMGSPYYMAPEQWADEDPDSQSDVYSLGVMLFQMLAGDVPFKGNSFPAIMKKHLSEFPPTFAEMGVQVPHQVETAVRHALEKDRNNRSATVDAFISELRSALHAATGDLSHTMVGLKGQAQTEPMTAGLAGGGVVQGGTSLGISTLNLQTNPPQSSVFINNNFIGASDASGRFILPGLPFGNHRVRISHDGYQDWEREVLCQSDSVSAHAELRSMFSTSTMSAVEKSSQMIDGAVSGQQHGGPTNMLHGESSGSGSTQQLRQNYGTRMLDGSAAPVVDANATQVIGKNQNPQTSQQGMNPNEFQGTNPAMYMTGAIPQPTSKLPIILSVFAIGAVFILIGAFAFYKIVIDPHTTPDPTPTPKSSPKPTPVRLEPAFIKGGSFMMGRSGGRIEEGPPHEVTVKDFYMDKTEVTNAEYYDCVKEKKCEAPQGWQDNKPLPGQEQLPVVFVDVDDVEKFADWRSDRDKVRYRLPTEAEWEYAARNAAKGTLYPWGNELDKGKAVIATTLLPVGSIPGGANEWGVMDLIGNVNEWTSTPVSLYPGNKEPFDAEKLKDWNWTRGGNYALSDWTFPLGGNPAQVTSTLRMGNPKKQKLGYLGFRLVRSATIG